MNVIIRMATSSDIPALLPLLSQLGYPTTQEKFEKHFGDFTNIDGYGIGVACHDNHVIGFIAWSKVSFIVFDRPRIHIEGLVVDQNYRGKAIGKQLMCFAEEAAENLGAKYVALTSSKRRAIDGTNEFYKNLGYHNEGDVAILYLWKEID